jgi:hypothetical protein
MHFLDILTFTFYFSLKSLLFIFLLSSEWKIQEIIQKDNASNVSNSSSFYSWYCQVKKLPTKNIPKLNHLSSKNILFLLSIF